jgi:hypothetical protein
MGAKAKDCDNTMIVILFVIAFIAAVVFGMMWGECDGKSCIEHGCLSRGSSRADYKTGRRDGCMDNCFAITYPSVNPPYTGPQITACETQCKFDTKSDGTTPTGNTLQVDTWTCENTCRESVKTLKLAGIPLRDANSKCVDGCTNSRKYRDCMNSSSPVGTYSTCKY